MIAALCTAGLNLVPIAPEGGKPTKGPRAKGWNVPKTATNPNGYSSNPDDFSHCDDFNFGLYHGASNTLALDLDNVELALKVFEELTDTQLLDWLENEQRAEVKSPKPNRGKLLFKLPIGFTGAKLRQLKHRNKVVFELRCGNCQDVIIGQHPEGGNYQFIGNPAAIPEAPAVLLDMLQHWAEWKQCFDSVLNIEPEAPKIAPQRPQEGSHLPGGRNPIQEFNQAFSVEDVLIRNDYTPAGKDRFMRPGSTSGAPGVVILKNFKDGVERVYSHGGDVLNDGFAHDAFDCFCLLECEGVVKQALGWSPEISKHNQRQYMRDKCLSNSQNPAFFAPTLSGTCAIDGTSDTRPLTELGNAQRIIDEYGQDIRYVYDAKAWLYWENGAWYWCLDGSKIRRLAATLPDKIYEEGKLHLAEAEFYAKHARISQKERTIEAAVSLLHNFEQIRLPLAKIDAEELLIGLQGARSVLDLKTGSVRPAQRNDFITKAMNVGDIGCSDQAKRWLRFLAEVFCDDLELIDWFKRWCGYLLTGSTREQFFVFCFGLGANGKSVLAEILRYISGDYARVVAVETLTEVKRQAGGATPDLADLIGARLALSPETEDGVALAESLIKSLVAGDTMTARKLYSQPIQFTPKFKLMMLGNHKPIIRGTDYGIWRRVRLLPFVRVFSEQERDPCLLETLKEEAPHILAWMAEGCLEWQKRGLSDVPNTIRQATVEYQSEQDLIGQWIAECCVVAGNVGASASAIYSSYKQWCIDNGLRTGSKVSLGRRLTERGFTSRKSHGNKIWLGIAVDLASDLQPLGVAA